MSRKLCQKSAQQAVEKSHFWRCTARSSDCKKPSGCGKTTLLRMIAGLETPAQTQPAETITTPTEEAPAAEEPAAAEEAPALSGKVTVYMPSPAGLADKLAAAFTEKTGVEVELFQGTTGEILARLEAEQANPVADVVILASWPDGLSMKADGQLESYTPANADKVNDGWIDEDNMGNTAQLRRRASAALFRQSCGLKSLKYIQYSCAFQALP